MNYANSAQVAGTKVPTPQQPIPIALGQLGTAIHEMGISADMLANRLGVVCMPVPPQAETKAGGTQIAAAPPCVSQTTDEVVSLRRRVENITAQLQDVLSRLEV